MIAKEYLMQYERAQRRAQRLKNEYERELEQIDALRSVNGGDGMPHGNSVSRTVEEQAVRLADRATRWKEAEAEALKIRQEVFELIHEIPGIEGDVLIERYINLERWENICHTLCKRDGRHYSWRGIHNAHGRALEIVTKKLEG